MVDHSSLRDKGIDEPLRVAIVTNIPTPYRLPVFEILARMPDINLKVVYCSEREPDREWDLTSNAYEAVYLNERFYTVGDKFIHANPDVFWALRKFKPNVIIGTGFNPTHLLAFMYAKLSGCAFIPMTDGTLQSEQALSSAHRWIRRRIYQRSKAFIAASDGGFDLYKAYGVQSERIFKSHLCTDNLAFEREPARAKQFDLIFSGRFGELKNPFFALEVAKAASIQLKRKVSLAFLGAGPLERQMRAAAEKAAEWVDTHFLGFARQTELPAFYSAAKVMLFPTLADVWGVVANEALAAGVPVIVSPFAGCERELVRHEHNGYVLPLDVQCWSDAVVKLLTDSSLRSTMAQHGLAIVKNYNYENAARGIADAIRMAMGKSTTRDEQNSRAIDARKRVVIIQRRMMHYRIPLFEQMRQRLHDLNIELIVIQGNSMQKELLQQEEAVLSWGTYVPCSYFFNGRICWQNSGVYTFGADLVIVGQENKLLYNLLLVAQRSRLKVAYWGHGRNFQAKPADVFSEYVKRWLLCHVDWWFAYTPATTKYLHQQGVEKDKITTLNNTIDSTTFINYLENINADELKEFSEKYKIPDGQVGIYCGSFYKGKDIEFLLSSAVLIREKIKDFVLIVAGSGPDQHIVEQYAREYPWIRFIGVAQGKEKAILFHIAKITLVPGVVGLIVVDAIISSTPLVTRKIAGHGPELDYLLDKSVGELNTSIGEIVQPDLGSYVAAVCNLFEDSSRLDVLRQNCKKVSALFSIEKMTNAFVSGIVGAIGSGKS